MIRASLFAVGLFSLLIQGAVAQSANDTVKTYVPSAAPVGQATLRYLLLDIYEATLFAPDGDWNADQPFALSLRYLRSLNGKAIAKRSVKEIRGQGYDNEAKLEAWGNTMAEIFPDVEKDTTIIGVLDAQRVTRFYFEGKAIGEVQDPEFGEQFFNIWLGERTSEPKLRDKILGGAK